MNKLYFFITIVLFSFLYSTRTLAQTVFIPDANFKNAVLNSSANTNGDSEIQVSEAQAYTG